MVYKMNGKVLKVIEYNLTFGSNDRMVNVFGCFKYIPTNSLYLVYADVDTKYSIVYYGSSHIKDNSILSMSCNDKKEEEIIKEYIFKVNQKETLENFEIISLENIEGIEIISSNKLEVKPEILNSLVENTIPKKEEKKEEENPTLSKKKKKGNKLFLILLIIILLGGSGYFYVKSLLPEDNSIKNIVCKKNYQHKTLDATVEESSTYFFDNKENLQTIETTLIYQFTSASSYQDFINKGTYYRYMPDDNTEGGWDKNDEEHTFKIITKERIGTEYNKPTQYEEVLAYYTDEKYTCEENINGE